MGGNNTEADFVPAIVPNFPNATGFEHCDSNCDSCDRVYDQKIVDSIDTRTPLYGGVSPLSLHICCCTGRTDWLHTIEDEEGSDAQRLRVQLKAHEKDLVGRDRVVLSNVSLDPLPKTKSYNGSEIMILSPDFCMLSNVQPTPMAASEIVTRYALPHGTHQKETEPSHFSARPMKYMAVVLICSHMRRDARCGKTAPVLLDEFDEQLREKNLLFDPDEDVSEDGKVLISCVSHIGGHKFAGNVLIYRRTTRGSIESIWLGRVFPHHVGFIVEQTIINGAVPLPLLRGGVRW